MELQVAGKSAGKIAVSDLVFACEYKEGLIHQAVTAYMAGGRQGTKAQKTRSDVSGGGAKPFRQKGTGRARAGTIRGPLWRKGGVTFAARPRDYSQKLNRKMYKKALMSILSELLRQERLIVVDAIAMDAPKTSALVAKLKELNVKDVLLVTEEQDQNVALSARNVADLSYLTASQIDPVSLISHEHVVMTTGALKKLEERLS